jgi:hypothetical protein
MKPEIRNEDRISFREGEVDEISPETLVKLRQQFPQEEEAGHPCLLPPAGIPGGEEPEGGELL